MLRSYPVSTEVQCSVFVGQNRGPCMRYLLGLLIFGFYFTSKILLVKVNLLVKPEQLVKNT